MSQSKTLANLITETLLLCRDPLGERFDTSMVSRKLNDAVLDFCLRTQLIKDELNVQLKEDVFEYNIKRLAENDGTVKDFGYPIRIGYDADDSPAIKPTDMLILDFTGYSRIDEIRPSWWYLSLSSPGTLCVIGKPTDDGSSTDEEDNMQVRYVGYPSYMSSGGSPDSEIPVLFHQAFPYGAAFMLLEDGGPEDLALAELYEGKFDWWVREALAETARGETPYKDFEPL